MVPVPADAARDARVAARRAADARKAGRALDRLVLDTHQVMYDQGWHDGYRKCAEDYLASELHHNRHYVPSDDAPMDIFQAHPEQYGRPEAGDDFLCVRCGGLESDARHG